MESFKNYLKKTGLAERTISDHLKDIQRFAAWAKESGLDGIEQITYTELLSYVQQMKACPPTGGSRALSVQTLNIRINSIRKYYEHLKEEGTTETNPAKRLHIKGSVKKIIHNSLNYNELEYLYHEYTKPKKHYREEKHRKAHQRNNIILGLMIWQAVHSGELGKIEVGHVKLDEGIIYIPGTRRSNGRELKLESKQIIALHEYVEQLQTSNSPLQTIKLFPCYSHNTVYQIVNELKGINPVVKNAQHIRASVILHWLRMYNKRQVQYMLGHKWISSTEHYQVQELTELTDLLTKHHPFS